MYNGDVRRIDLLRGIRNFYQRSFDLLLARESDSNNAYLVRVLQKAFKITEI